MLALGRLPEAGEVVREALSLPGVPNSAARARLAAMLLAVRRGNLAAADLHRERAEELIPELEDRPGLEAPPMLAEHLLAHGRLRTHSSSWCARSRSTPSTPSWRTRCSCGVRGRRRTGSSAPPTCVTTRRRAVAEPLRTAHVFAVLVGAVALDRRISAVAQAGGIRLDEPALPAAPAPPSGPLATLTEREREVLAHLVAGRTYSEIASALVISEKTVSSHVSHVLRKTDTRSRRELSELAQRLASPDAGGQPATG